MKVRARGCTIVYADVTNLAEVAAECSLSDQKCREFAGQCSKMKGQVELVKLVEIGLLTVDVNLWCSQRPDV